MHVLYQQWAFANGDAALLFAIDFFVCNNPLLLDRLSDY